MGQVRGADCDFRGADVWGHIFGAGCKCPRITVVTSAGRRSLVTRLLNTSPLYRRKQQP